MCYEACVNDELKVSLGRESVLMGLRVVGVSILLEWRPGRTNLDIVGIEAYKIWRCSFKPENKKQKVVKIIVLQISLIFLHSLFHKVNMRV